jgi:hypothetical protein
MRKLLLNVVTAGIEAHVVSGNKFMYDCVKEISELIYDLTPSFNSLLLKRCAPLPVLQVGKQVVVSRSEISAARRVVNQLTYLRTELSPS